MFSACIYDEAVAFCLAELAAVVGGYIFLQSLVYECRLYAEVQAHGYCGENIGQIIGTDEVCLHGVPLCLRLAIPADAEHGIALRYLSLHVWHGFYVALRSHVCKVGVLGVQECEAASGLQVIV